MGDEIPNDVALQLYETMQRIRSFELAVIELFARGKIPGFLHTYVGEEAIAAGVCANLRADDKIISTHRGHGHLIAKGGRLDLMMAELFGKETGYCKGKGGSMHIAEPDLGMLGANAIVGAGTAIINGAALTAQFLGKDEVAVGEKIVASGLDGVFPKGLHIGKVTGVVRRVAGIFQEVTVTPYIDFEKLEEVLVLPAPQKPDLVEP